MTQIDGIEPLKIWKGFHSHFFVFTQGLIICFCRFESAIETGNLNEAQSELETAAGCVVEVLMC